MSRDSDEAVSRTKPSHRPLTVKTAQPIPSSHLPPPTKVSNALNGARLHTISPSNPATRNKKRRSADQQELVADLGAWRCHYASYDGLP